MRYLVMVDFCYRGSVESQFFEPFYGVLNLSANMAEVDVVLRGNAVTAALEPEGGAESRARGGYLWPNGSGPEALPDPREPVRAMLAAGVTTYVDEHSLRAFGLDAAALLPGVICLDTTELAARWADYDGVWFL